MNKTELQILVELLEKYNITGEDDSLYSDQFSTAVIVVFGLFSTVATLGLIISTIKCTKKLCDYKRVCK